MAKFSSELLLFTPLGIPIPTQFFLSAVALVRSYVVQFKPDPEDSELLQSFEYFFNSIFLFVRLVITMSKAVPHIMKTVTINVTILGDGWKIIVLLTSKNLVLILTTW
jgi:hypothetical protein